MNSSKIILVISILWAGLTTAQAETISLYQNSYSYSDGGEFTAYTSNNLLSNYASVATLNGGFETFCLQSGVLFNPGTTYSYVTTDTASTGQKLSMGAAYLYSQFANGTLAGYDYSDPTTRLADNGELQSALWAFQDQTILSGFPSTTGDPFYNLAINNLGGTTDAFDASNGAYGVDILQLYDANGNAAQAQLGLVTPEPPTVLLFLFAGALFVFFNRKRMIRTV